MDTKYLEEKLKMLLAHQKMLEDERKKHPVIKETLREYHTKERGGICPIF